MKVYIHSHDLYEFNLGKSDQIVFHRKRPECDDLGCKIIRLELSIRAMDNKKREAAKQNTDQKKHRVRHSKPGHNSR